jgi:PAS domain-containing protein
MPHVKTRTTQPDTVAAERDLLRAVVDLSPTLICVRDARGRCVFANEAMAAFHGTTLAALLGTAATDPAGLVPGTTEESVTDTRTGAALAPRCACRSPCRAGTSPCC